MRVDEKAFGVGLGFVLESFGLVLDIGDNRLVLLDFLFEVLVFKHKFFGLLLRLEHKILVLLLLGNDLVLDLLFGKLSLFFLSAPHALLFMQLV